MTNGTGKPTTSEKVEVISEQQNLGPVINIDNKGASIRIEWKHIVVAFGLITSAMSTVGIGGYLFMPARQSDMEAVNKTVKELQIAVDKLGAAVATLNLAVGNISSKQPATIYIERPARERPDGG